MANKLIMTTITAVTLLILSLFIHHSTAATGDDHFHSHLSLDECDTPTLYGCKFYLSGFQNKPVAYKDGSKPLEDEFEKQMLSGCCDELQNLDEECRCTAIEQTVNQLFQNQCDHGEEKMNVVRAAVNLPERCNLLPRVCLVFFSGSPSIC